MKIELSIQPSEEELKAISDGISAFNAQYLPEDGEFDSGFRFVITARNESGEFIGGIQASVVWSYCVLELLWLSEESRGKGLGSKLIKQLVEFATEKGLSQIRTETLDFQAKPFYEKQGFRVYGELEDTPKGHKTYFLVKAL
ncbi:TPA: GNAT family N-acetyltransferase [Vibrio parahaemolyticus]|uniref:GNAT family N-acetyltransferase n=1 Tax=Vibrio parahaemolyticus TaxID=670 RepID=A0AA47JEA5_VIBPH|nr:GNAT family N-acetyltransferase [Vibrio parahaemolyticus]MCX8778756.1 GNAT family N-acetyltransferase [Vibrio parahaemolyticus]MDF4949916.1 GNAT family N-acetyltransferase [Vibrio parahaemolyticus]MEA5349420.1 GNAT family N-acetyltransferase [Vibrio parahaemolyticus]ODY83160.1 GNAT family N-acetyltransferase [Vibrio parahaemolyticus]WAT89067.1 GNAT family N-acetyltransferase [Vibrio parahaemolyticus]